MMAHGDQTPGGQDKADRACGLFLGFGLPGQNHGDVVAMRLAVEAIGNFDLFHVRQGRHLDTKGRDGGDLRGQGFVKIDPDRRLNVRVMGHLDQFSRFPAIGKQHFPTPLATPASLTLAAALSNPACDATGQKPTCRPNPCANGGECGD